MTHDDEKVYIEADQCVCILPREFVDQGEEIKLCAGVQFVRLDEDRVELVLLTEADVEALTAPEASGV